MKNVEVKLNPRSIWKWFSQENRNDQFGWYLCGLPAKWVFPILALTAMIWLTIESCIQLDSDAVSDYEEIGQNNPKVNYEDPQRVD